MAVKSTSASDNNKTTSNNTNTNANNINAKYLQHKYRMNKAQNSEEQKDALMFESLLQSDKNQQNMMVNALQHQQKDNQQFNQDSQEEKKDNLKTDVLKEIESKNIVEAGRAEKTHAAQFCQALTENHNKHNFEVTLPKIGTFKIQTNASGKQLKFDVSTGQKNAFDWITKNQSNIEENVGKDLNLDVSLGIEYAI